MWEEFEEGPRERRGVGLVTSGDDGVGFTCYAMVGTVDVKGEGWVGLGGFVGVDLRVVT